MLLSPEDCGCSVGPESVSIVNTPVCSGTYLFMMYLEWYMRGRCDFSTPCQRVGTTESFDEADFIVVGAGSAGSIVAGRLSEDPENKVLLLEAGDVEPIGARVPSFYPTFIGSEKLDWRYRTVPSDKYCRDQGDKGCKWARGKGIGGTSLLNGMMYHKGHEQDFKQWVEAGAEGWSWEEMQPFFDMTEGNMEIGSLVNRKYHSDSGPLPVQRFNYQPDAAYILMDAINETGIPLIDDMNDPNTPEGFNIAQTFNKDGQRYTTARAYLTTEHERPNLRVTVKAHVTRILFSEDKKRAIGVQYINSKGENKTVIANKEVILCAGALNSPQILLLSGVGPKETMEKFNIPQVADLPVGKRLLNHVGVTLYFLLTKVNNTRTLDWSVFMDYMLTKSGPMSADGITQLTGLVYSSLADKSLKQPDIQIFFNGFYATCSHTGVVGEPTTEDFNAPYNITMNAATQLPLSEGYVTLQSTNPLDAPIMDPNFFSHPSDMIMAIDGVKYLEKIFKTAVLQHGLGIILDPAYEGECASGHGEQWSEKWAECMIRLHTDPQNHQLGTTAIGSVVNPQLEVYGIEGLRVCDAGSMPTPPTGNPQGPIMAVAEKCAYLIMDKWTTDDDY